MKVTTSDLQQRLQAVMGPSVENLQIKAVANGDDVNLYLKTWDKNVAAIQLTVLKAVKTPKEDVSLDVIVCPQDVAKIVACLNADETRISSTTGRLKFASGKKNYTTAVNKVDVPPVEMESEYEPVVFPEGINHMFAQVEAVPVLQNSPLQSTVFATVKGQDLTVNYSNGHIMIRYQTTLEEDNPNGDKEINFKFCRSSVKTMRKIFPKGFLAKINKTGTVCVWDQCTSYIARQMETTMPPYDQQVKTLLSNDDPATFEVSKADFMDAVGSTIGEVVELQTKDKTLVVSSAPLPEKVNTADSKITVPTVNSGEFHTKLAKKYALLMGSLSSGSHKITHVPQLQGCCVHDGEYSLFIAGQHLEAQAKPEPEAQTDEPVEQSPAETPEELMAAAG